LGCQEGFAIEGANNAALRPSRCEVNQDHHQAATLGFEPRDAMMKSLTLSLTLAATLCSGTSAWAQNVPVLSGSSSTRSGSAVTALTLTAPSGLSAGNVMLANLSQSYGTGATVVSLSAVANVEALQNEGTNPVGGGIDNAGYAFDANLVGSNVVWNGVSYPLGSGGCYCAAANATVALPSGNYSVLYMIATGLNSAGANQTITVTYTDGSTTSFAQSFSDWGASASYSGETIVSSTQYRVSPAAGAPAANSNAAAGWDIYGYSFSLDSTKTVQSVTLPATRNVVVFGISMGQPSSGAVAPSGWTELTESSTGAVSQAVWYRIATSADVAGASTYAFTFPSSGLAAGSIMAFGGVSTTNPVSSSGSEVNGGSTSYTAPASYYMNTDTWVGLYTIANGTTSGSDFQTIPASAIAVIDTGTGSGTSGVLIGGLDEPLGGYCFNGGNCLSGTWIATSNAGISAASIGTSVILAGATPAPSALWHMDESSWSGAAGEVIDSSSNGYNGVAVHGATPASNSPALSGSPGTCSYGSYDGSTQYVQLPSTLPHIGNNATITAWIRPTSNAGAGNTGRILSDDYAYNGYAFSFGDPGNNRLRIYLRQSGSVVDSAYSLSVNTWYFVVADFYTSGGSYTVVLYVFSESGSLLDTQSVSASGTWSPGTGAYATIGGNADSSAEGPSSHFPGNIDEVTMYATGLNQSQLAGLALATHPCTAYTPDHYAVSAAGTAVNCQATPVTIAAHSSAHAAFATTATITATTSTGHGDWTLTAGGGTFTAGGSNSGSASYTYAQGDNGSVVLSLRDTYPESLTVNVTDGTATAQSGSALAAEDSPITFAASGFRITNGNNAATPIGTQQAGVSSTQSLALQAVRTDTSTGACTNVFAGGTSVNVSMGFQCNNPTSCVAGQTLSLTNGSNTVSLPGNPNSAVSSYVTVPLKFTTANGEAPFTLNYTDSGQIKLTANYNIPLPNGAPSATTMTGASQFVVQPYTLVLANINVTTTGTGNPAASTASGAVFTAAGQAFTASVTAMNYQGTATPNFGQEISPPTVTLTPNLILPTSGHNPAVSGGFGPYSSGTATGTTFSWPEVGIITLTPAVAVTPTAAGYLGSGAITGTTSGNVGRFIPNAFSTTKNTPVFATACAAGSFGYVGQPFTYIVAPMITTTALAVGGATTQNYTGSLMRLSNSSLTGRSYIATPSTPSLNLTGLPASSADPAIVDLGTGQSTLTFSAGSGLLFNRGGVIEPFNANIALAINVIDLDGVTAANPSNPVTFGAGDGIAFNAGARQYYGRLLLGNALGSELLDLPMPLTTQYYKSVTQGFVTNTTDSCTTAPPIGFGSYQANLVSGETCVRDSGSPGSSGQGCAVAASNRYSPVASAGTFNLILAAPGAGNSGALTVTAAAPSWLQYIWNTGSATPSSPAGIASFGLFPGSATRIYQRETY